MAGGATDAARAWRLNHRLSTGVIDEAASGIAALGLEVKEFFVLDGVEETPYPAELAKRLFIAKPTITMYLKSLEAKGFVRREIDPEDLRRHRLLVTPSGRSAVTRARAIISSMFGKRLARLNDSERDEFQRLLEKLSL